MAEIKIRKDADTAGIRPQDLPMEGQQFTIQANADGATVTVDTRKAKKGGDFQQYTLHVTDKNMNRRRLSYLFESHLAPLARAYGDNPLEWDGQTCTVKPFKDGQNWGVEITAP